jgi:hypothetical protein
MNNPLAEAFARSLGADNNNFKPVSGPARENYAEEMQPQEFAPGTKVQWKGAEYKDSKFPEVGETVEVFRMLSQAERDFQERSKGSNHAYDQDDFTVLYADDGELTEFGYSSRRFKVVD